MKIKKRRVRPLTYKQREVLKLREQGFNFYQIACMRNVSGSCVREAYANAKHKLYLMAQGYEVAPTSHSVAILYELQVITHNFYVLALRGRNLTEIVPPLEA